MGNNTIWMREFGLQFVMGEDLIDIYLILRTVAYKQAALNAIAYLQKVLVLSFYLLCHY